MKKLVAYFSATGVTAQVAAALAEAVGADVFAIQPQEPYSKEDLDWWENESRSTIEMKDPNCRPLIAYRRDNMLDYDLIFVGFPIWWNAAPRIINSFLEDYDFTGKIIVPFATSGGSGVAKVNDSIVNSCKSCRLRSATLLEEKATYKQLSEWANTMITDSGK